MNILGMKHYICCLSLTTRTVWVIGQLAGLVFTNPNKIQKLYTIQIQTNIIQKKIFH